MRTSTVLWPWMAVFAFASALDLLLTWVLLKEGAAVEANPLAGKILAGLGWLGLGVFKAGGVAVVLLLGFIICRTNRIAARRLLQFGSGILLLVVGYSGCLLARMDCAGNRALAAEKARGRVIVQKRQSAQMYFGKLDQLTGELLLGKVTLSGAARELAGFLAGVHHNPLPFLQTVAQGLDLEGSLAVHLVHHAGYFLLETPERARVLLPRLQSEFASAFYGQLPKFALAYFPKEAEFPEAEGFRSVISLQQPAGYQDGPTLAQAE